MCKNRIRHVYWAAFSLFAVCSDSCGRTGTVSVLHLMRSGGIHWKLIFKTQLKHHGFVREMMMMMVMMMTMLIMMMAMETVEMVLLLLLLRMRYTQMTAMTTMIMGTTTTMKTMKKKTTTMIMTMIMTVTIMTMATKQWVRYFTDGTLGGIDLSVLQVVAVCQVLHLTQASAEPVSV